MKAKVAAIIVLMLAASLISCRGFFTPETNNGGGGNGGGGSSGNTTTAKFLYVANSQNGSIAAESVATNGQLTTITGSPFVGTNQPVSMAITPDGTLVAIADQVQGLWSFLINRNDGTLPSSTASLAQSTTPPISVGITANFAYSLEQGFPNQNLVGDVVPYAILNGTLNPITGTQVLVGLNPHTLKIDPSGKFLYVAGDASGTWIFSITQPGNILPGTLVKVGQVATTTNTLSEDVAIDPNTKFAYVANGSTGVETYSIDVNGNLTRVGNVVAAGTTPIRLAVTPNGKFLYVVNQSSNNISEYSISAGALTSIGTVGTGAGPNSIAIDPSSAFVYVTNFTDGTLSTYSINSTTGVLTGTGTLNTGGAGPSSVVVTQ
jgi:DNA-binding beta-propeller fold protein YncE